MPYEVGEVVLVPFPFTNQAASKRRPAVVISNPDYNAVRPDVIVMPVTSQLRPAAALGEVWVTEWQAAGAQGVRDQARHRHARTDSCSAQPRSFGRTG